MIKPLLTAAALSLSMGTATAASINPLLARSDVCGRFEVFHINGIMTNRTDATNNRNRIAEVYGNAYKEHLIYYGLAYNQTRSFPSDFYDSAVQVISGYVGATWDSFMNAVTFSIYSPFMPDATAKAIAIAVTDLFSFAKPSPYQDQDLADIMLDFSQQSRQHARLVIVPHSQGNLYANLVYDKLVAGGKPAKSIGVVGVAVPYLSVRSGNTYITSANDVVIDATRKALPTGAVLGPNVTIPYQPSVDKLGHNLRTTYLANSTVQSMLNSRITSEFNGLKTTAPDPTLGIRISANGQKCGHTWVWTGEPMACFVDVPTGSPPQWYTDVIINYWSDPNIGPQQHSFGTGVADLDPLNRAYITTCYAWWIADRKARITSLGFVPTSQYSLPFSQHSGSCGQGFPWQTPYGIPDRAWTIYSADSYTTISTNSGDANNYSNTVDRFPRCTR